MKKMKRLLAVLLAAIMTLAMAATTFAAEQPGSLTVNVNAGNTLNGQTIEVYKLFDLSVSEDRASYAYTVNEQYKTMIASALGEMESATSEDLYNAISALDETAIQKFADDFTAAALQAGTEATVSSGQLGEVTSYTFGDLEYGYYLVYQTGTKEIQSSLVSVDDAGVVVNLKGQAPSIEKTADKETVEIGKVVVYTVTGTIPDTTGYDEYTYIIHDTLTDGLDFATDAQGILADGNTYDVSVQIIGGTPYVANAVLSGEFRRTMTLDLSQWVKENQNSKGKEFKVTYYAKVNENAVVETKNSAALEYGNALGETTVTTPSEAKTPTYPLQIHKMVKDDTDSYLAGATFRLYRSESDAQRDENPIAVTGTDGNYTVDSDQKTYDMVSAGHALEDNPGMNLRLNGLAAGTYWLVETAAPDGYNGVTQPIKITITKSADPDVNNWTISKGDGEVEADQIIDVENSTGTKLPGTGGMGTVLFTVAGVVLIILVAASFVISRRKRA